jgi:hypothetical protein
VVVQEEEVMEIAHYQVVNQLVLIILAVVAVVVWVHLPKVMVVQE